MGTKEVSAVVEQRARHRLHPGLHESMCSRIAISPETEVQQSYVSTSSCKMAVPLACFQHSFAVTDSYLRSIWS